MRIIPISSIHIPETRQRREFKKDALQELASSISSKGLLHPIVVRSTTTDSDSYILVAGERRVRAIQLLEAPFTCNSCEVPQGFIPATLFESLNPIEQEEAELEENIIRVDLLWTERCSALARLHEMRVAKALLNGEEKQTIADTAREISRTTDEPFSTIARDVGQALVVSRHLSNPKVATARTLKEAYNLVSYSEEADFKQLMIATMGGAAPHIFIQTDCIHYLRTCGSELFDCILVDPPYGMDANEFGAAGFAHEYDDSLDAAMNICSGILHLGFKACKSQAHLYMFCDIDNFSYLKEVATEAGWYAWRTPLIWFKGGGVGHDPIPGKGFRRSYECILYCIKGDRPHHKFLADVIEVPTQPSKRHAAEKPVELYRRLLERSCSPGDLVLDPCAGTGTIFPAATKLYLNATGIEIDGDFAKIADGRRLEDE